MADETPAPLEDEDAFYRRVSRRLEEDTGDTAASREARRLAVLNTLGAPKVSEEGEILGGGGLGTEDYYGDPDLDRRVEEHREKEGARPSTEIRPLKFTDDPAMYLRGKVKSALTSREMDSAREKGLESLEKIGWKEGALPVSAGPIPGIIPWFTQLALKDPKEASKLFLEVTGSVLNPGIDAALAARDLKHAVDTGNVPLGVLAGAGLIVPGYSGAKAVGKRVAGQVAERGVKEGAEKVAKEGGEKAAKEGAEKGAKEGGGLDVAKEGRRKQYMKDLDPFFGPNIRKDFMEQPLPGSSHELATPKMRALYLNHLKARHGVDDLDTASPDQLKALWSDWSNASRVDSASGRDFIKFSREASKPPPIPKAEAPPTPRTGLAPEKQQEELRGMIERDVGQTTGAEPEVGELEDFIRRHQNAAKVRKLNLTPQDYDDLAATIKANGGATFDLGSKTHAGSGYSIAPFKATEFSVAPENFNAETIETYIRTNSDLIEVDGMHFGAWFNEDTGGYVYDVSMVAPNTPAGRLLSARLAKQGKQDAVWHLDIGKEIKTLDLEAEYGGEILKGATTPEYEALSQVLGRVTRPVHTEGAEGLARKFGISEEEVGGLAEKRMQAVRKALAGQK